jgi:hypothetical protein
LFPNLVIFKRLELWLIEENGLTQHGFYIDMAVFHSPNSHAERIRGTGIINGHAALFLSHLSSVSEAVPGKYMHLKSRNPFMPYKTIQSPVRFLKNGDIA